MTRNKTVEVEVVKWSDLWNQRNLMKDRTL